MIYLDYAATTSPRAEVCRETARIQEELYGNPSAVYTYAAKARSRCNRAKKTIAAALGSGVSDSEIVFVSGGTEGNNWCIKMAAFEGGMPEGKHFITTAIEHPSVLQPFRFLERCGAAVTYIRPAADGIVRAEDICAALRPNTVLVSVMAANNEVGTIQPVAEIGARIADSPYNCYGRRCLFHVDAVQAFGHIPLDVKAAHIDLMTTSAHKLYGPKGVGFVYKRDEIRLAPLLDGGGQEQGLRSGTENVAAIAGMECAVRLAMEDIQARAERETRLRNKMIGLLRERIPSVQINGDLEKRLPGNINLSIPNIDGEALLVWLDMKGICVSTGSACAAGKSEPSYVLTAMGRSEGQANSSLRLTLGLDTTEEEIVHTVEALGEIAEKLGTILA